ncbi:MAG: 2TM domain-containing protein [Alphaproteobacteria bacterium]|nr:2TM domain-containing protein [Alphaproteobacteria bacterium]MBU1527418.1 2TM domain-containing protein [Alphaproteobacteria bacterium]MBU2117831.1 2TM domain-containing protein [Alphaproteobacteria bacterium]MBU2350789.1 2TM domain-containing protein [Alphaproteobacteria bacterium]MBU2381843.1 2TM domain-containing protein [Alphaproteobacteria bacterium]
MTDADAKLREQAERRVEAKRSVISHLMVFVIVNAGLFAIDWYTGGGIEWAFWPLFGWGIGLASHMASVWMALSGSHEAAVEREMERLRRQRR